MISISLLLNFWFLLRASHLKKENLFHDKENLHRIRHFPLINWFLYNKNVKSRENNEKHYNAIGQISISSFSRIAGLTSIISCSNERKILVFREKIEFGRAGKQGAPKARCFIVTVGYYIGEARSNGPPFPCRCWPRGVA